VRADSGRGAGYNPAMEPRTLILRTAGTNCDVELAHAFALAGSESESLHLNALIDEPARLERFDLLGIPGGFSYGDDIAAGRIFANRLRHRLMPALQRFIAAGKPVIGICNGFQVLVKAGLLGTRAPAAGGSNGDLPQVCTLADNARPRFVDRWVNLRAESASPCIWTRGLEALPLPVAHGEGRFTAPPEVVQTLETNGQVALRYVDNPNGSVADIAGICDPSGLVFGLMPHPERYTDRTQHPQWTRLDSTVEPAGLKIFTNAVQYVIERQTTPA